VIPVFADGNGDTYVQRANATTIEDFEPVELGEEYRELCLDGQAAELRTYRKIGDEALFGFSPSRHRYLIGNGTGLSRMLVDRLLKRREDDSANITEPTRDAIKRFFLHVRLSPKTDQHAHAQVSEVYASLNKTALIVDDSHFFRSFTTLVLERMGIVCVTAVDGIDAFDTLGGLDPDFVFLDLDMPRMNGHQFTREFRRQARFNHIPIVVVTTMKAERHRLLAEHLGAQRFVEKPCSEVALFEAVTSLLGGWELSHPRFGSLHSNISNTPLSNAGTSLSNASLATHPILA